MFGNVLPINHLKNDENIILSSDVMKDESYEKIVHKICSYEPHHISDYF